MPNMRTKLFNKEFSEDSSLQMSAQHYNWNGNRETETVENDLEANTKDGLNSR